MMAAGLVSFFVNRLGLIGLLHVSGASYVVSAILSDMAFGMATAGGFEPRGDDATKATTTATRTTDTSSVKSKDSYTPVNGSKKTAVTSPSSSSLINIFHSANTLFRKIPVLGALFLEVVVSQSLSSLVNFIYLYKLKSTITDDAMRAGWSGTFYAWINGVSGVMQFFAIPILLNTFEAHRIWLFMPTMMLCCTLYSFATFHSSGLLGASASFFAIKTMEYSLRGAANEMIYVSLDYESRYFGKKVISLIAGKFGKSSMAVALSLVMPSS